MIRVIIVAANALTTYKQLKEIYCHEYHFYRFINMLMVRRVKMRWYMSREEAVTKRDKMANYQPTFFHSEPKIHNNKSKVNKGAHSYCAAKCSYLKYTIISVINWHNHTVQHTVIGKCENSAKRKTIAVVLFHSQRSLAQLWSHKATVWLT